MNSHNWVQNDDNVICFQNEKVYLYGENFCSNLCIRRRRKKYKDHNSISTGALSSYKHPCRKFKYRYFHNYNRNLFLKIKIKNITFKQLAAYFF